MKKIMSILDAIDAKAQDLDARHWQGWLRYADRYVRKPNHRRGRRCMRPVSEQMDAVALILWARKELNIWFSTRNYDGIEAAIALGY